MVAYKVKNGAQELTPSVPVSRVPVQRMEGSLSGRQRENQPAFTGIHVTKAENIAKKFPVRFWIVAKEQDVSAKNHLPSLRLG